MRLKPKKMKKQLTLALIAVVCAASITSCKKDYTCSCTVASVPIKLEIKDAKKKDAKSTCDQAQTTYRIADPTATCNL